MWRGCNELRRLFWLAVFWQRRMRDRGRLNSGEFSYVLFVGGNSGELSWVLFVGQAVGGDGEGDGITTVLFGGDADVIAAANPGDLIGHESAEQLTIRSRFLPPVAPVEFELLVDVVF